MSEDSIYKKLCEEFGKREAAKEKHYKIAISMVQDISKAFKNYLHAPDGYMISNGSTKSIRKYIEVAFLDKNGREATRNSIIVCEEGCVPFVIKIALHKGNEHGQKGVFTFFCKLCPTSETSCLLHIKPLDGGKEQTLNCSVGAEGKLSYEEAFAYMVEQLHRFLLNELFKQA